MNNNEFVIIKGRIDNKLDEVFKSILNKLNMTQQDFLDKKIKEFIIENIYLITINNTKNDRK